MSDEIVNEESVRESHLRDVDLPPEHPASGDSTVVAGEVLSGHGMSQPETTSGSSDVGGTNA